MILNDQIPSIPNLQPLRNQARDLRRARKEC